MTSFHVKRRWLALGFGAALATGGLLYGPVERMALAEKGQPSSEQMANIEALSSAFRHVAKSVRPAVVQITSTAMTKQETKGRSGKGSNIDPDDLPEPLKEFFKEYGGKEGMPSLPVPPQRQQGSGSGFIIDAEKGLILTNNHVVGESGEKADVDLRVTLADGRRNLKARVISKDASADVALLQINADHLQAIQLGDSSKMEVGDWVLAIGAPFGLEQTVTQGIISATDRNRIGESMGFQDWIQTDAAINPGNSGGPLVNMRGEVIGINVAIATSGLVAGYQGVGFAIPINDVKDILPDLREGREVVRGYLGVKIQGFETQPGIEETYGLKANTNGVIVEEVQARTPAAKAGLKLGDVILSLNDHELKNASNLQYLVARTRPGDQINLKVWRDNKEITIPVTIEKQPTDFYTQARQPTRGGNRAPREDASSETEESIESLGMTVEELNAPLVKRFGLDEDEAKGQVVITEVQPLGEAAAVYLSPGDIIVRVQDKNIKSTRALRQALSDDALEHGLRMQVKGKTGYRTIFLKVSPSKGK